jgi:dTDP-4-dehydrorhamnose reductase
MRILLTGVSGQLGGALLPRLRTIGTVIAPDSKSFDLAKLDLLADILDRVKPQLIINPAAYTAVEQAEDERERATAINAMAPGILARWAAARNVPLVHFSTDYVFGGSGERPWREDDQPMPLSTYGLTKLAGERAIRAAGGCHLILRTAWVYASRGKNFLNTIVRLAQERKELRIVADQIGAPTSASLISDAVTRVVADGIDHLRDFCADAEGLVHFTASGETSWYGFARSIVEGLKKREVNLLVQSLVPVRSDEYPTRARRPQNSRLDLTRWYRFAGHKPPHWETALEQVLDELAHSLRTASASRRP